MAYIINFLFVCIILPTKLESPSINGDIHIILDIDINSGPKSEDINFGKNKLKILGINITKAINISIDPKRNIVNIELTNSLASSLLLSPTLITYGTNIPTETIAVIKINIMSGMRNDAKYTSSSKLAPNSPASSLPLRNPSI